MEQTSFKDWINLGIQIDEINRLVEAVLFRRPLVEGNGVNADLLAFRKQTNQVFTAPPPQGLGFPQGDWVGLMLNTAMRHTKLQGQDKVDLAMNVVNRFLENMLGINDNNAAAGVGGGMGEVNVERFKQVAASGDVDALRAMLTTHTKLRARTYADYYGGARSWRQGRDVNMGMERDDDDYKPVAFASKPSGQDREMEFRHLADAIVQELKRGAMGGKQTDQNNQRLAADVAAHWFQDLDTELGAYQGPTPDRNRSPLKTQRELLAQFPQISLGTLNTQIMPRIRQAVVNVIGQYGSGAAQVLAQKLGNAAAPAADAAV